MFPVPPALFHCRLFFLYYFGFVKKPAMHKIKLQDIDTRASQKMGKEQTKEKIEKLKE